MADERLDKGWQKKGLASYSTAAILGSLAHYGVSVDEAGFKSLAQEKFPLAIAESWHEAWKGTGQFSRLPVAAAEELWSRLSPDALTPGTLAEALAGLMTALSRLLDGAPDAPVGDAFAKVSALRPKVPLQDGAPLAAFMGELEAYLGQGMEAFDQLGAALAKEGHVDDAEAFAELEAFLFPSRLGVAQALVRAAKGEHDEGIGALEGVAQDEKRSVESRLRAVDGLLQLGELGPGAVAAEALLDVWEKAQDHHAALDAAARLAYALEKLGKRKELDRLHRRAEAIEEAHHQAHPHHPHG